ncbi:MAG TPA: hypothetical protein VKQ32_20990 [Polyangia bacterium]|nr:hypothetical protein [Polyangia bacterium]
MNRRRAHRWWGALAAALALLAAGCATTARDGLDAARLPADIRPDYALFARRCSKCHQLARPLGSGIHDDAEWADYVERMRRQPGSGISPADTKPILRFLHYYSTSFAAAQADARGD